MRSDDDVTWVVDAILEAAEEAGGEAVKELTQDLLEALGEDFANWLDNLTSDEKS